MRQGFITGFTMSWLYIFIFMITANVLGNAAAKIGWLTFQGADAQKHPF